MPTLHKTQIDAAKEAKEIKCRYKVHAYVVQHENIYGDNYELPGFEALIGSELRNSGKIVETV